jgi:D-threonate/D-erythronate kinase
MKRILVIADDLTGAAEIGGIAAAHGLSATIQRGFFGKPNTDALVIDTDTRHLSGEEAAHNLESILKSIEAADFDLIYKKTDSMLRGPVAAELFAVMSSLHFDRAIFVPQNPSRGRIIQNGQYLIDGQPLHHSPVAADVEYPPTTCDVIRLLDPSQKREVHCIAPHQSAPPSGITIGAAANAAEIQHWALQRNPQTLPAGSADFFSALLQSLNLPAIAPKPFAPTPRGAMFIFGSASTPSRDYVQKLAAAGAVICEMPIDPPALSLALHQVLVQFQATGHAFIAARSPVLPERAAQIRMATAELVAALLPIVSINTLFIEGGATASAIVQRLRWDTFQVESPLAPGIVALRPAVESSPVLALKPGTYPWPPGLLPAISTTAPK